MKTVVFFCVLVFFQILLHGQTVNVSTATELQNALNAANPGQTIILASGTYSKSGGFYVNVGISGTQNQPITLQGNSTTIITSGSLTSGYGFYLKGKNNYWVLDGFTVRNSQKAIVLDSSSHNTIRNINALFVGGEAIHLRSFSSYNTVENCFVDSTGRDITQWTGGFAEGIYIGSANSNWAKYTAGKPDTANYNVITGNTFGDSIISENIDIKEGTTGGTVSNNSFNGRGLNGANSADSWVDVKGNYWKIECNTGSGVYKNGDGLQSHIVYANWGDYNTFSNNTLTVGSAGYGINVQTTGSKGTATHNVVCDNNSVNSGTKGISNITTQTCPGSCLTTGINSISPKEGLSLFPNPANDYIQINLKENTNYIISDITGKTIKTGTITTGNSIVDISELNNGLYLINFIGTNTSLKFIKE